MKPGHVSVFAFALGFCLLLVALTGALVGVAQKNDEVEMSEISGDVEAPRRHFRLRGPARLGPGEAETVYRIALGALAPGYARSGHAAAKAYSGWRRYNTAPYLSSTHGNHYINNYANSKAENYGRFENAGRLPVGSVIAKDSFSVTETGGILLGPLFLMEKMPARFNYVSGDWKYTLIQPDGTLFGETNGENSDRVQYCVACHLAVEHQDHLYFVPRPMRVKGAD